MAEEVTEKPSATPWAEARREELLSLIFMLSKLGTINQGSGFLGKAQECINVAKDLASGSVRDSRLSFVNFLTDEAGGEQPLAQEDPNTKRAEAIAAIKKAEYHIHDILVGAARFRMSTSPDPNDSVSIICDALKKAKALLSEDNKNP